MKPASPPPRALLRAMFDAAVAAAQPALCRAVEMMSNHQIAEG